MTASSERLKPKSAPKKAVLLGGTSAIGCEILRTLAKKGYELLFTFFSAESLAADLEREFGPMVQGTKVDLASLESVTGFMSQLDSFGGHDAFINSAGIPHDRLCMQSNAKSLLDITMINYLAPALLSARAAALMCPRRSGFIVNITSAASRRTRIGNASYGSSKLALERFTASLALEVARFKIRTLCVAPAFVNTPMFARFAGTKADEIIRSIPMRQILSTSQVAEVVLQFVSGGIATTGNTLILGNGEVVF